MNLKTISRNIGYALLVSALFMFLSAMVALLDGHDTSFGPLLISFTITFIVGAFPFIFVRRTTSITLKEGYLITVLSWLLSFIFGMLPYALWGGPFTVENAWFESVSGFTTTGATILRDIEALPKGLLFWRSSTHFIGGLGVVVFLLLIIPGASPIRMRLTNMELSSISRSSYSTRSNKTVFIFAYVYFGIFILSFVSYLLCGMSGFDAICQAFSVSATGGFSTRNLSIAAFNSHAVEFVTIVFMLLSSIHFGLIFLTFATRSLKPLKNPVLKFYLIALAVISVSAGISLRFGNQGYTLGQSLWYGLFQTVSIASTTGFALADNASWPMLTNIIVMIAAVMCGCAGSTVGGIKADRAIVMFKAIGCRISKNLHPSSINEVRLGNRILTDEEVYPHILYVVLYFILLAFSVLLSMAFGVNDHSAFAASVSTLGNVGQAIRELGGMGNYDAIPSAAKFLYTFNMFLGRIEIYPFLAVVAMIFDSKRR